LAQETILEGIITFLGKIGVFRVILPFILVFTIMYALLDRTRVLGTEKAHGADYPKKNLNAMVAFVSGFLVIASSELVSTINQTIGQVVLVVIVMVLFLLLAGSFHEEDKKAFFIDSVKWKYTLITISFISVILIFLQAIPGPKGEPFLEWFFKYLAHNWQTEWVGAIILIILIVLFMWWIGKSANSGTPSTTDQNKS